MAAATIAKDSTGRQLGTVTAITCRVWTSGLLTLRMMLPAGTQGISGTL